MVAAPVLTPYDPANDSFLADSTAMPSWIQVFPGFEHLPPTIDLRILPGQLVLQTRNPGAVNHEINKDEIRLTIKGGKERTTSLEPLSADLVTSFEYRYDPPETMVFNFDWRVTENQGMRTVARMILQTPSGKTFELWDSQLQGNPTDWLPISVDTRDIPLKIKLGMPPGAILTREILKEKGMYQAIVRITSTPLLPDASYQTEFRNFNLKIPGLIHGILGTDHLGNDLFSQLAYGGRISLFVGITVSVISVVIGIFVGVIAGYKSGALDEGLMRSVDILLAIPGLPLLIVLAAVYGSTLANLILVLSLLSWMGTSRVIRSMALSIKEATFVEAAKAVGAKGRRIILRHIIPNVLSIAFATFILGIPGAILAEASLSFLGLTDPTIVSWGRMLFNASSFGAFTRLQWWWILPPGLAITLLALSFVFIGHALDEILNPRLRRR